MSLSPTLPTFLPTGACLVRVEGRTVAGDLFGFDMIHYGMEPEHNLIDRALLAFQVYNLTVDEYKINV